MTGAFEEELADLVSAEDFLDHFGIVFDEQVVRVYRLHILQRFHNYLAGETVPADVEGRRQVYARALTRAYADFVRSDAQTEKVFKVFRDRAGIATVPISAIGRGDR